MGQGVDRSLWGAIKMQKGTKQYIAILSLCVIAIYLILYVPRYIDYFKDTSKVVTVQGKIFFHLQFCI